jgi:Flp pilus assembly protein TadG
LVEFALVAPLFLTLLFGLIEFALIGASVATFNFAAKDAARLGSLLGKTDPNVDAAMVALVRSHVAGIVVAQTLKVEIYKSSVAGDVASGVNGPIEDVYDINGVALNSPQWGVNTRNDQLLTADYLGVRITYQYTYLTSFISGGAPALQLTANSVQRIEPQDYQAHAALSAAIARARPMPAPLVAQLVSGLDGGRVPELPVPWVDTWLAREIGGG